jgi:hypothetical protein
MELYSEIMLKNLQSVRKETSQTFIDLMYEKQNEIKSLIKQRWLFGKKPDGTIIGQYHSGKYANEKNRQNPKAGLFNVDLIDTGSLVEAIKISMINNGFEVFSTDIKYNKIADKYGDDNFNITDKETEEIINEVSVATIENLYNKYML